MSSFVPKILYHGASTDSSPTAVYSAASGNQAIISALIVSNVTAISHGVNLCVTSNGAATSSACAILWDYAINPASEDNPKIIKFTEGQELYLTNQGVIGFGASAGAAVLLVLGKEIKI